MPGQDFIGIKGQRGLAGDVGLPGYGGVPGTPGSPGEKLLTDLFRLKMMSRISVNTFPLYFLSTKRLIVTLSLSFAIKNQAVKWE